MKQMTGGNMKIILKNAILTCAAVTALGFATPALASGQADGKDGKALANPAELFRSFALATIEVAKEAAQATSDTVHHNIGNAMGTAAKARGFVRDSVGGVLGNARKVTGMVGDMMPLTTHNHYENATPKNGGKAE